MNPCINFEQRSNLDAGGDGLAVNPVAPFLLEEAKISVAFFLQFHGGCQSTNPWFLKRRSKNVLAPYSKDPSEFQNLFVSCFYSSATPLLLELISIRFSLSICTIGITRPVVGNVSPLITNGSFFKWAQGASSFNNSIHLLFCH